MKSSDGPSGSYLFLPPRLDFDEAGVLNDGRLNTITERDKLNLSQPELQKIEDPISYAERRGLIGMVVGIVFGVPSRAAMILAKKALKKGFRVLFFWPEENTVELVDEQRLGAYWRIWVAFNLFTVCSRLRGRLESSRPENEPEETAGSEETDKQQGKRFRLPSHSRDKADKERYTGQLRRLEQGASPLAFRHDGYRPSPEKPMPGCGVYLRTDYWSKITSGGSYGHTCYVAKELSRTTDRFVAFLPHRYELLDHLGVHQIALDSPGVESHEKALLRATSHYYNLLKIPIQALQPAYIYERLVLGNITGALLSLNMGVPYLIEYNGSEISMKRSFDKSGYRHEEDFLAMEMAAFNQATAISVISEQVRNDLTDRGVDPNKILVNPNGVDTDAYGPLSAGEKGEIRSELGWRDTHRVVGFIGTFGGWHGIEVLAASIPIILEARPQVRFLIIGDGNLKHLLDEAVARNNCGDKVKCVGRVPQAEGARLLKACDIFVSPHHCHMVDSPFFGSPTKLFEYMALGGGIVASDLEQLGQVLSPGLPPGAFEDSGPAVDDQRAVLCKPGRVDQFVAGVVALVDRPDICQALGANAREAAVDKFSWAQHVKRLWDFAIFKKETKVLPLRSPVKKGVEAAAPGRPPEGGGDQAESIDIEETAPVYEGGYYKRQAQKQWDNDPCGSHYVKAAPTHTMEWFLEAERYRYQEYAPWMFELMEFGKHKGDKVLEIGSGMGTDLAQFAKYGALVTDLDLSTGHLALAQENFAHRGLQGRFLVGDAEVLPFAENSFDLVYSNGVIHHIPDTYQVAREIYRVLRPGGKAICMVYAEHSRQYWYNLLLYGLKQGLLHKTSFSEIMSTRVEISNQGAAPLVKVYNAKRLKEIFQQFSNIQVYKRQLLKQELHYSMKWIPIDLAQRLMGWNLIIKADKPR